jgi:predicted amino acid racemase
MAYLELNRTKLANNYQFIDRQMKRYQKDWAIVTKLLCGNEIFLKEVLDLEPFEVCDSRIANLETIKKIAPDMQTVYIKPPAQGTIERIVKYADVSFNSESKTIRMLSEEAQRQGKVHRIVIMIELGDLREGIMGDHLIHFYEKIFELPNIQVVAIGANLNCLNGVMPSQDKFIQLSLYKQLIETKFNQQIPWVSGGTSVVLPLLDIQQVPTAVNHFRIGETLFFGADLFNDTVVEGMHDDVLKLYTEIIEITKKPKVPIGALASNPSGEVFEIDEADYGKEAYRAILDIGLLDIDPSYLVPDDPNVTVVSASSDMLIVELNQSAASYQIGDQLSFKLKYMGALSLLNSDYVDKRVVGQEGDTISLTKKLKNHVD